VNIRPFPLVVGNQGCTGGVEPSEVMIMEFEIIDKRMTPLGKAHSITIQKRGLFS
jgi:hypothetical protein